MKRYKKSHKKLWDRLEKSKLILEILVAALTIVLAIVELLKWNFRGTTPSNLLYLFKKIMSNILILLAIVVGINSKNTVVKVIIAISLILILIKRILIGG